MASKPGSFRVLRSRGDFQNISKSGYRIRCVSWFIVNYLPNDLGVVRCGWTLPRRVGSAVVRNRLKRWTRVFLRRRFKEAHSFDSGLDLNFVFLRAEDDFYKKLKYAEFSSQMEKAWAILRKRI